MRKPRFSGNKGRGGRPDRGRPGRSRGSADRTGQAGPAEPADYWSRLLAPGPDNDFLEKTACPACGETAARVHGRLGPTNLKQCRACGIRYVSPRLAESVRDEMVRRTPSGMDSPRNLMLRHIMAERLQNMQREMYSLEGVSRNAASLLEVGSAWGHFLQLCRPHFGEVDGIELSKEQAMFARERFDLEVSRIDIFREPWDRHHHVIVAWELLDHIAYPTRFLSWAHDHLLPGGQLILSVPNFDSLYRRILGSRWFHFDPARHLTYYTAGVLRDLLHKAGFADVTVHTSGRSLLRERFSGHNQVDRSDDTRAQWLETLRIREALEAEREQAALGKVGTVAGRLWNGMFWKAADLLSRQGLGDELRIYARRE